MKRAAQINGNRNIGSKIALPFTRFKIRSTFDAVNQRL